MGIFDYFRHGKRAKELGLTVSQYLEFVQYQESDKLTIEEYKSYLVQYSEDKSVRQYIDQMRTGVLGAQSKEAESGLISMVEASFDKKNSYPPDVLAVESDTSITEERTERKRRRRRCAILQEQGDSLNIEQPEEASMPVERIEQPETVRTGIRRRRRPTVLMEATEKDVTEYNEEENVIVKSEEIVSQDCEVEYLLEDTNKETAIVSLNEDLKKIDEKKPDDLMSSELNEEENNTHYTREADEFAEDEPAEQVAVQVQERSASDGAGYAKGNESENLRKRLEVFLRKLSSAYPDKVVSGLAKDHKHWAETLTSLYRELGYPDGESMLEAYGFTVVKSTGGRPVKDHSAVIEELKKQHPQPFEGTYAMLLEQHPEFKGRLKTLTNKAQMLFGMSLSEYLMKEGILASKEMLREKEAEREKELRQEKAIQDEKERLETKLLVKMEDDNVYAREEILKKELAVEKIKGWRAYFSKTILERGRAYSKEGKVTIVERDQDWIQALVRGSEKYEVRISTRKCRIKAMSCTCPYARDGLNCKHMAAVIYSIDEGKSTLHNQVDTRFGLNDEEPLERNNEMVDMPEVWDPPVYHVEEINITGDELKAWEYERQRRDSDNKWVLRIRDYLGSKDRVVLPAYIDGERVDGLTHDCLTNCKASYVEIPGIYGVLKGRIVWRNRFIKTVVIGEGITQIDADAFQALGAVNKVEHIFVSASLERVKGTYSSSQFGKYFTTPWMILGRTLLNCGKKGKVLRVPQGVKTISSIGGNNEIQEIILPDSVTAIYDEAFMWQKNLKRLEYTPALKHVGMKVFNKNAPWYRCFTDGIVVINHMLYQYLGHEETVVVPDDVVTICRNAFYPYNGWTFQSNQEIKRLVLPDKLETIEEHAFYGCQELKEIVFGRGLKSIKGNAFYGNRNLANLELPDSLTQLGDNAFYGCGLEYVRFGTSLRSIGMNAFYKCKHLKKVFLNEGLASIGQKAFYECQSLEKISIPKSIQEIGESAFAKCTLLNEVQGLEDAQQLSSGIFEGCSSLIELNMPKVFGECVARNCSSLKKVVLHPNTDCIAESAFENCTDLREVVWPKKLKKIGKKAFTNCSALTRAELSDSLETIGCEAFRNCTALDVVSMPENAEINIDALTNTPYLRKTQGDFVVFNGKLTKYQGLDEVVEIPEYVKVIGEKSFAESKGVKKLIIGDWVESIESFVFGANKITYLDKGPALQSLFIGNGVKTIAEWAFSNCGNLTEIRWGNGIVQIGMGAFSGCPIQNLNLEHLKLKRLEPYVFDATRAKTLILPESLEVIAHDALKGSWIEKLDMSKTKVKYIGESAFKSCGCLKEILWSTELKWIAQEAFSGITLDCVKLPRSVERVEACAFSLISELVAYDFQVLQDYSIKPDEDKSLKFFDSSHLVCALSSRYGEHNRKKTCCGLVGYYLTVIDSQTDKIMYRIFVNENECGCLASVYGDGWNTGKHYKFKVYDRHFMRIWNLHACVEMAFCRLEYPYDLSDKYRRMYEAWMAQCLYIESSARRVADLIASRDEVSRLELLERYGAITVRSVEILNEAVSVHKAQKCRAWLKKHAAGKEEI